MKIRILCSIAFLVIAACSPKSEKAQETANTTKVDVGGILNSSASKADKAEKLALAGEQLVTPIGFMYADALFDLALENDSANQRALFYKAILKPTMATKGLAKRVRPLIQKFGDVADLDRDMAKLPESAIRTFLLDAPSEDLKDEADAQRLLSEVRDAFEGIREYAKTHKNLDLTLNMTLMMAEQGLDRTARECWIKHTHGNGYYANSDSYDSARHWVSRDTVIQWSRCDISKALQIKLGQAEMEALQHYAAAMQLVGTVYTAYSVKGMPELAEILQDRQMSERQTVQVVKTFADLGRLNSNHGLGKLKDMASDLIAGTRWVIDNQATLCPTGNPASVNREGFVLNQGLCFNAVSQPDQNSRKTVRDLIAYAEAGLRGPVSYTFYNRDQSVTQVSVNFTAPLTNPVTDLKAQLPDSFNECGNATGIPDKTLGGLFVGNTGEMILKANKHLGRPCFWNHTPSHGSY